MKGLNDWIAATTRLVEAKLMSPSIAMNHLLEHVRSIEPAKYHLYDMQYGDEEAGQGGYREAAMCWLRSLKTWGISNQHATVVTN